MTLERVPRDQEIPLPHARDRDRYSWFRRHALRLLLGATLAVDLTLIGLETNTAGWFSTKTKTVYPPNIAPIGNTMNASNAEPCIVTNHTDGSTEFFCPEVPVLLAGAHHQGFVRIAAKTLIDPSRPDIIESTIPQGTTLTYDCQTSDSQHEILLHVEPPTGDASDQYIGLFVVATAVKQLDTAPVLPCPPPSYVNSGTSFSSNNTTTTVISR